MKAYEYINVNLNFAGIKSKKNKIRQYPKLIY